MGRLHPFGVYLLQKKKKEKKHNDLFLELEVLDGCVLLSWLPPADLFLLSSMKSVSLHTPLPCWIVDYNEKVKWHSVFLYHLCFINIRKEAIKPPSELTWATLILPMKMWTGSEVFIHGTFWMLNQVSRWMEKPSPRSFLGCWELWPSAGYMWTANLSLPQTPWDPSEFHGTRETWK